MASLSENIAQRLASRSSRSRMFTLSQRNIYIFPTRQGFAFLALLLLMLVTAINYQSSLIYLFLFVLGAVFFISIWLCFLNLSGLQLSTYDQAECFAGQACPFHIRLFSEHVASVAVGVGVARDSLQRVNVKAGETLDLSVFTPPVARGLHTLDRLRLESTFPFGMIIAWTWLKLDAKTIAYPKSLQGGSRQTAHMAVESNQLKQSTDELTELRSYQSGDASNRIVWKHYAAKDQVVVRTFETGGTDPEWLRWDDYDVGNVELKLSYLCFDVINHSQQGRAFGLDIPGRTILPNFGEAHRRDCLSALALFSGAGRQNER